MVGARPQVNRVKSTCRDSHVSLSLSSGVGAMSTALLLWQLRRVGSAPWLSNREHTSTRFLEAASCRGVNCQRSMAFTQAPCCRARNSSFTQSSPNIFEAVSKQKPGCSSQRHLTTVTTTTTYFEQKLCDFKVAVGTSVMERNEAAAEPQIRIKRTDSSARVFAAGASHPLSLAWTSAPCWRSS